MIRLSAVRVPRLRLSFDWLGDLISRTTILYVGYTAVLFIVFLIVTFPHKLLISRVVSGIRGPVTVEFADASFAWLKGYELSGMRIGAAGDGLPPLLECTHVWVHPAIGPLLRGNPYDMILDAELYGGTAHGEVVMNGATAAGSLQLANLSLGRYRTLTALLEEGQIAGRLSGLLTFEGRTGAPGAGQLTGDLLLDGAALSGAKVQGFTVPDVHVRQIKAKFVLHGDRLEIQELQSTGDISLQGSGQIVLRDPPTDSVLNLHATVEQSLATPDAVKAMMAFIPRAPGAKADAPISITGTVSHPRFR